jgi:hypothetical protein
MPEIHCLHYGSSKNQLAKIVPDSNWSGMWRIAWPDGRLSDMVNLTRARDAAIAIAERGPPARDRMHLRWQIKPLGEALGSPVAHFKTD